MKNENIDLSAMIEEIRVLILDDLPSDADIAKRELKAVIKNPEFKVVDTEKDYVQALKTFKPQVIISDYTLPSFDGLSALNYKNDISPFIPFVLMTGSINEETAVEVMKTGADDYVIKEHVKRLGPAVLGAIKKKKVEQAKNQSQIALLNSELQNRSITETAADAMISINDQGMISSWNKAAEKIFGYSYSEILNKKLTSIMPSKHKLGHASGLERLRKGGAEKLIGSTLEITAVRKNGEEFPIELSLSSWTINDKKHFTGIIRDITERKKAEIELVQEKDIFNLFLEHSPIYLFFKDENIRSLRLSKNYEQLLGKPINELIGKNMNELFPSALAKTMLADDIQILKEGKQITVNEEFNNRHYETIKFPIQIKENVNYLAGFTTDITERKRADEELKDSEEKLSSLVNNSPNVIMRIDLNGAITYINYYYSNQKPEDLIGKTVYDLIPSAFRETAHNVIDRVLETGNTHYFENLSDSPDNNILWNRNHVAAIRRNGKIEGAIIIVSDITEEKQASIMQGEFIASISHELRTPLTTMRESLSMLAEELFGKLNKDQADLVNPCLADITNLANIINNLISTSDINTGTLKLEREMVDINTLAQNTLSAFEDQAARKKIDLVFTAESKSLEVYLDKNRIIQVFMNLIGNANKFTKKGRIEVSITDKVNEVEICVADTGRGIEQKDLGTLFDKFHQIEKVMRTGEKGSGVGLSIVKGIVKTHKGEVRVSSKINQGSKFYFTLPKYTADEIIIEEIDGEIKKLQNEFTKRSFVIIRLNNIADIQTKYDEDVTNKVTKLILSTIQNEIAPGEFSFINDRNEVVLFSNVTRQNIAQSFTKLEDLLKKSVLKIEKNLMVDLSYSYSAYPDNGKTASELIQFAGKTI